MNTVLCPHGTSLRGRDGADERAKGWEGRGGEGCGYFQKITFCAPKGHLSLGGEGIYTFMNFRDSNGIILAAAIEYP